MAGASTCSDPFSLVRKRFEPRLVSLEPSGHGGDPAGRALAVVARSGRMNAKTRGWSWRRLLSGKHRGVTYRDPDLRSGEPHRHHAEPLGSLGLNGAGDDPVDEYILTGGKVSTESKFTCRAFAINEAAISVG
ncbi:hypothetical protein F511_27868 [Dorcoceras hygrometricum]|uniref:Uncharacterized protein n=1 Tax=Dorcoceras hygrometricum TaxID=472368 RepID=A0A2Z7AVD2_9LAMI|nr:hypothetical protein F511_27868 [Dorcoceras hygrometricum]